MDAIAALNLFVGIFNLVLLLKICQDQIVTKINVENIKTAFAVIHGKLSNIEILNAKLGSGFNEFINMTGEMVDRIDDMMKGTGAVPMYRTMDGKFSARSLDELIKKIKKENKESDYLTDEEMKKLKELFDSETEDSDDDDEEK